MENMTFKAALKLAKETHGMPYRFGFGWMFTAPYHTHKPNGPCTEISAQSYQDGLQKRARRIVCAALELSGVPMGDAEAATHDLNGSISDNVTDALSRLGLGHE